MKINDFIGLLFLGRDIAHSVHLNTRSYAKHMALTGFYEEIIPLADSLAEAWQGRNGLMGKIQLQSPKVSGDIVKFLEGQLEEIESGRASACGDSSALQNIVDEIVGLYLSTLYKLKFLA